MRDGRIRVAVIYGGRNSEHSISVVSAGAVIAALDPDRYEVVAVGITLGGKWVLPAGGSDAFQIAERTLPTVSDGVAMVLPPDPEQPWLMPMDLAGRGVSFDVAFPVLHGRYGEDGTIQGLFEMAGVPYVGAGVFASAAAMDKEYAKKLLAAAGSTVGPYVVVRADGPVLVAAVEHLGLPVFVKPARAGSSVGISKVRSWDELPAAVELAREHDRKVLIEAAVIGREIEVGVLEDDNGRPSASVPAEIRLIGSHDWYDFDAKYLDDACEFDVPAKLDGDTTSRLQAAAVAAFEALGGAGLARVDFFLTDAGEIVVNEVNTMPGFTPISMFPRMWAASGVDYPTLVDRLVQTALRRGAR
jgi:D-alanine-D-alanine ligase